MMAISIKIKGEIMKVLGRLAKITSLFILVCVAAFATEYDVDRSHSSVGFKVKHMMISNVAGTFNDFHGIIDYDKKTKKIKSLTGTVNAASVDTGIEKRDAHLKSEDFFDIAKYPQMQFKMVKIEGDEMTAELTIRDVTKKVKFKIDFGGAVTDPWGNERVGLELEGKINRKDFGLAYNKVLETGGLLVDDKVKINLAIEAVEK